MIEWDLLEKTTFWIEDATLYGADLGQVSAAAAKALGLQPEEVIVVDVRDSYIAFDILRRKVNAELVVGQEKKILESIKLIDNVKIGENAGVHSEGILGLISINPQEAELILDKAKKMTKEIVQNVNRRAIVFASGVEVKNGSVKDTNSPYIVAMLQDAGFTARFGGILEDDEIKAANDIMKAVDQGFGLIITTGGVGAENKDFSVEAVRRLDKEAYTPWILKFNIDNLRHHKDKVCIAVGRVGLSKIVALPGPHEEAKLGCIRILEGLHMGLDEAKLAEYIADGLRSRWRAAIAKE